MLCVICTNPTHCANIGRCGMQTGTRSALDKQESGNHYKDKGIQPIVYIHANNLGFCAGNVVKYVTRYKSKNGKDDILKAIHYLELLLELEYGQTDEQMLHKMQK
jgi:hypothetical protein